MKRDTSISLLLRNLGYLLTIHVFALLIFGLCRLLLLCVIPYQFTPDVTLGMKLTAFVKGLWFDNVICCYIVALPMLLLWINALFGRGNIRMLRFCTVWFDVFYSISFFVAVANVPYFCYFFQNLNSSVFQWFEFLGTTLGLMFEEKSYWAFLAGLLILLALWWYLLFRIERHWRTEGKLSFRMASFSGSLVLGALVGGLVFLGIRGRLGYNPIKVSQAYFCQDAFLNQLGVNPVFNLLTSWMDDNRKENKRLALMDDNEAVKETQRLLSRQGIEGISPIARFVNADSLATDSMANDAFSKTILTNDTLSYRGKHPNVVVILMESMSASLLTSLDRKPEAGSITPFLDSLYTVSWSFKNMYSAGNHTNHGMYATLYSWPAIMFRNLMKGTVIPHYAGLPTVLHDNGYHNFFFMTHESQYDNMNAFFRTNGFDDIYAQENYPADKVVNSFGVQDDFLYGFAVPKLTECWRNPSADGKSEHQPFFSVLLSISNHPPYVIPSYFHPKSQKSDEQIVEYADWSIRQFFDEARRQPWFDNTIFVLLADHGKLMESPEGELPQSYNHIPLMIYGKDIPAHIDSQWALQVDVAPTLLSLLGISYTQNNFGMNLLQEHRDCVFYTGDKIVAARDSLHLFLYNPSQQQEICYNVTGINSLQKSASTAETDSCFSYLKNYVFSMLQAAETLVGEKKTLDKK